MQPGHIPSTDCAINLQDTGRLSVWEANLSGASAGISAGDKSTVRLYRPTIGESSDTNAWSLHGIEVKDQSSVAVLGGSLRASQSVISVEDDARLDLYGGQVSGKVRLLNSGLLHVYGQNLSWDGEQLQGELSDGSPMRLFLDETDFARVVIHEGAHHPFDFNQDRLLNVADIDQLTAAVRNSTSNRIFDTDVDGQIDWQDIEVLTRAYLDVLPGDANLDESFDSRDLVQVFTYGQFEDRVDNNSGWAQGDWDGNGDFTTADLTRAFQVGQYADTTTASHGVPEPGLPIASIPLLLLSLRRCRRIAFTSDEAQSIG